MLNPKYKVLIEEANTRGKDHVSMQLCGELLSLNHLIVEQCGERVGQYALSEGRFVVMLLLYNMGELTPSELSSMTGLTRSAMTSVMDFLEKHHYAVRNMGSADRRSFTVSMVEEGKVFFEQVLESQLDWLACLSDNLDADEKQQFLHLTRKMALGLKQA
jgi:DNA-binding MarR family transcriptional regulator